MLNVPIWAFVLLSVLALPVALLIACIAFLAVMYALFLIYYLLSVVYSKVRMLFHPGKSIEADSSPSEEGFRNER